METDGADATEVQMVAPSGDVLGTFLIAICEAAAKAMRTCLESVGKRAKGVFVFTLDSTIIEEHWSFEFVGVTAGSTIIVTVLDSLRPCFEWTFHNPLFGNSIQKGGHTFTRGSVAKHTDGVRSGAPLPRETRCYVSFDRPGAFACLGVGTSSCNLELDRYGYLYGQDQHSWALCFGTEDWTVEACHKGLQYIWKDLSGKHVDRTVAKLDPPEVFFSFLISDSGEMRVTLPGYRKDMVVPFEVPRDLEVFAVASSVYGGCKISISAVPFEELAAEENT